jgi:DNA-binding transcriptional ArsR family regulator
MRTKALESPIATALFGKARRAILALLFGHPDEAFYLRQLARASGSSASSLQRDLATLVDAGIIERKEHGNLVYFRANRACPVFAEIQGIVTKTVGVADVLRDMLQPFRDRITTAFVFGSIASGEARASSDVDLFVIGDASLPDMAAGLEAAEARLARTVSPVIYSKEEFAEKARAGNHFIQAILDRPKLFLVGTADGLSELVKRKPAKARRAGTAAS